MMGFFWEIKVRRVCCVGVGGSVCWFWREREGGYCGVRSGLSEGWRGGV